MIEERSRVRGLVTLSWKILIISDEGVRGRKLRGCVGQRHRLIGRLFILIYLRYCTS
jgi:hypothetical protein